MGVVRLVQRVWFVRQPRDNPIVPIRVLPAAGTCAMSPRALGSLRCFPRPISVKRVPGALAAAAAAASASSLSAAPACHPFRVQYVAFNGPLRLWTLTPRPDCHCLMIRSASRHETFVAEMVTL
jgi:hypothetical protein